MRYSFKKGQIVPKKIGSRFVHVHKKARHNLTWGCDVEIETSPSAMSVKPMSPGSIFVSKVAKRKMNNGTYQNCGVAFNDICLQSNQHWSATTGKELQTKQLNTLIKMIYR